MRHNVSTHGYAGYTNGCRCAECKTAKRLYMRAKRRAAAKRREQAPNPRKYVAEGITHGTYAGYTDAQCRCYQCSAAKSDQDQRRGKGAPTDAKSNSDV
jgi:hypothetical protein